MPWYNQASIWHGHGLRLSPVYTNLLHRRSDVWSLKLPLRDPSKGTTSAALPFPINAHQLHRDDRVVGKTMPRGALSEGGLPSYRMAPISCSWFGSPVARAGFLAFPYRERGHYIRPQMRLMTWFTNTWMHIDS